MAALSLWSMGTGRLMFQENTAWQVPNCFIGAQLIPGRVLKFQGLLRRICTLWLALRWHIKNSTCLIYTWFLMNLYWSFCRSCPLIKTLGLNMSTGFHQTAMHCIMGEVNLDSLNTQTTTCPLNLQPSAPPPQQHYSQPWNLLSGVSSFISCNLSTLMSPLLLCKHIYSHKNI